MHSGNELVKFADDTDLVVAASNVHTCIEELDNIKAWAERNNLKLNESKSVEIVFRNPRSKTSSQINPPPTPMGIVRMKEIKTLGVTISDTLSIKTHVNNIISSCGQFRLTFFVFLIVFYFILCYVRISVCLFKCQRVILIYITIIGENFMCSNNRTKKVVSSVLSDDEKNE